MIVRDLIDASNLLVRALFLSAVSSSSNLAP